MVPRSLLFAIGLLVVVSSTTAQQNTPTTISIWWPDTLYPLNDETAADILETLVNDFNETNEDIQVEFRLKRSEGEGSILATLTAGIDVATAGMPDLVVLSRRDLVTAARDSLIRPVDDWLPDELRQNLLPGVLSLGEIEGDLYGYPYAITVRHAIYQMEDFAGMPQSYDDVVESEAAFYFRGADSQMLIAQYLANGGRLVDANGLTVIDEQALLNVLAFYAAARDQVDVDALESETNGTYWALVGQTEPALAIADSTLILQRPLDYAFELAPLPHQGSQPLTILSGWIWAVTTAHPERNTAALAFLRWMADAEAQSAYTEAFGILPASRPALRIWQDDRYADVLPNWLPNSIILPTGQRVSTATLQIQTAFEAVLEGMSPEEATEAALNTLNN